MRGISSELLPPSAVYLGKVSPSLTFPEPEHHLASWSRTHLTPPTLFYVQDDPSLPRRSSMLAGNEWGAPAREPPAGTEPDDDPPKVWKGSVEGGQRGYMRSVGAPVPQPPAGTEPDDDPPTVWKGSVEGGQRGYMRSVGAPVRQPPAGTEPDDDLPKAGGREVWRGPRVGSHTHHHPPTTLSVHTVDPFHTHTQVEFVMEFLVQRRATYWVTSVYMPLLAMQ
eukprot:50569-Chlamydomonas_euryale.AAC.1